MSRAEELANKTGAVCEKLRRTPMPIADVVPHMQAMADELRRLAQVEAEHAALKEELEAEREETKRWRNAAKWEQEIRKQAEMIADKAVTEHAALLKAISDAEPVAHLWQHGETGRTRIVMPDQIVTADANWSVVGPLYTLNGIKK